MHFYGASRTREIYAAAIDAGMSKSDTLEFSLKFAELERGLGEVDRARAIYTHASQFANPKTEPRFWKEWNDFEVSLRNEDTFRDMLRVRRAAAEAADASYYAGLAGTVEMARVNAVKRGGATGSFGGGGGAGRRQPGGGAKSDGQLQAAPGAGHAGDDVQTDEPLSGTKRPAETEMDILERLARAADAEKAEGAARGSGIEQLGFVHGGTLGKTQSDAAADTKPDQDGNEIDIE